MGPWYKVGSLCDTHIPRHLHIMSRGAAYSKRRNLTGKQAGSTMGPSGTVDFDDLARRAGQGLFVDQDFPADDTSIYTDGQRSGFGAIKTVHTVMRGQPGPPSPLRCMLRLARTRVPRLWVGFIRKMRCERCALRDPRRGTTDRGQIPGLGW